MGEPPMPPYDLGIDSHVAWAARPCSGELRNMGEPPMLRSDLDIDKPHAAVDGCRVTLPRTLNSRPQPRR